MTETRTTCRALRHLLALLAICLTSLFADASGGKKLVVLNAYNEGAPWAQDIVTPIMREISTREGFSPVEVVHLNSTTIHNSRDFNNMADGVFRRFADHHPDFLVLVGNFAFTLRERIKREWGDIPILLIAQSDLYGPEDFYYTYTDGGDVSCVYDLKPLEDLRKDFNFSLVVAPNYYEQTIDMMVHMFPAMDKLVFIADALYVNRHLSHKIREYMAGKYPSISYEWLIGNQENGMRLQSYLNNNDYNTGLLLSTWFFERMTVHGYPQLIAGEARIISGVHRPVFGLREAYFRYGITGGCFPLPEMQREYIHKALMELVAGKEMRKVPFLRVERCVPIVDYGQLEAEGIPVSSCPPGTIFLNRPKTAWEQYRLHIITAIVILLAVVGVAITIALFQRRRIILLSAKSRAEKKLRETVRKLDLTLNVARITPWRWDLRRHVIEWEVPRPIGDYPPEPHDIPEPDMRRIGEKEYVARIHPDDTERVMETFRNLMAGKMKYARMEYRIFRTRKHVNVQEWVEINATTADAGTDGAPDALIGSMLIIPTARSRRLS